MENQSTPEKLPEEGEIATCARCGKSIAWEFDNELDPYGFWYDEATGTESCIPGPNDEDRYHQPEREVPYAVVDDQGVKAGETCPVLGRFESAAEASAFIAGLPDAESGRYGIDGPEEA